MDKQPRNTSDVAATRTPPVAPRAQAAEQKSDRPEWIPEGTRAELAERGEAIDPRDGRRLVGSGTDDARYEEVAVDRKGARVQASDVAGSIGATRATNEHTK
jgi:hypothetical protein